MFSFLLQSERDAIEINPEWILCCRCIDVVDEKLTDLCQHKRGTVFSGLKSTKLDESIRNLTIIKEKYSKWGDRLNKVILHYIF
jgi:hypothetical protein